MIEKSKIEEIRQTFKSLTSYTEKNIKIKVVVELLKVLGYELEDFNFEHAVYHNEKRVDFVIEVNTDDILYVETKRGDKDLAQRDIIQIANYLNTRSIEWGLLSNGRKYVLINNLIVPASKGEASLEDKIVFDLDILSKRDLDYMEYLSKRALFDTKITNYFRDIAQFRAYKYPLGTGSWRVYKSTLFEFFKFYANKERKYRPLEEIRVDDFEEFLIEDQKKKSNVSKSVNSEDTFNNKYSHVRSMFNELKVRKKITSHHFEEERKRLIQNMNYTSSDVDYSLLNEQNVEEILNYIDETQTSVRDKVIFLFCVYLGLERSTVRNLQWSMFNANRTKITLDKRTIPIPSKLTELLKKLENENKDKGIKGDYLFYAKYKKKYNVIYETTVNDIFNKFQRIDLNDLKWKSFSPQFVRNGLISRLFNSGFSLEEIVYMTGADLISISNIISYEDICISVNSKKGMLVRNHPFKRFLE